MKNSCHSLKYDQSSAVSTNNFLSVKIHACQRMNLMLSAKWSLFGECLILTPQGYDVNAVKCGIKCGQYKSSMFFQEYVISSLNGKLWIPASQAACPPKPSQECFCVFEKYLSTWMIVAGTGSLEVGEKSCSEELNGESLMSH